MIQTISASQFVKKQRAGIQRKVFDKTEAIVDSVAQKGFAAVAEYTRQFDSFTLDMQNVKINKSEFESGAAKLSHVQKASIDKAFSTVEKVQKALAKQALKETKVRVNKNGYTAIRPRSIERIGIYVPGGVAPLPSSLLMAGVTARAAGVKEIVVCTSPNKNGISPAVLYVAKKLGISDIYQIGGAQAIASMAYGLSGIMKKVDMVCGPGNVYTAVAKQIVSSRGLVKIDMMAGPSEVLIIADDSARTDYIAADMLAQAEHGTNSPAVLLTDSKKLAENVCIELEKQLSELKNNTTARKSIDDYGAIVLLDDLDQAVKIANNYAPEHLEVMVQDPEPITRDLANAGAIFVNTCEAFADYGMSGGNHILPTGGTARFASGLSVYDFIVRTYVEYMNDVEQQALSEKTTTFAELEGLEAHANAAKLRGRGADK
jgi:histidinol dehydrogenase